MICVFLCICALFTSAAVSEVKSPVFLDENNRICLKGLPDSDMHHKTLGGALHTNKQPPKWQRRHQLAKFGFYS